MDRYRMVMSGVTCMTLICIFLLVPPSVYAVEPACTTAVKNYKDALEKVMDYNHNMVKKLDLFLKDTQKSAKRYKATSSEITAAIKDNELSRKEKRKIYKMGKKLDKLEKPYKDTALIIRSALGYIQIAKQKKEVMINTCK